MTFIVQFFHAPQVDTLEAALAYVDGAGRTDAPPLTRFRQFANAVVRDYPDLSEDDVDGDDDRNLWPEGIAALEPTRAVVNVALKSDLVDDATLKAIAAHAAAAGLLMLDPQGGVLYRGDGRVVRPAPRHRPSAPSPIEAAAVREQLQVRLQAALAPHGFALHGNGRLAVFRRRHEGVLQMLVLQVYGHGPVHVKGELWLSAPELADRWVAALPPEFARWRTERDHDSLGVAYDFTYGLSDVVPTADAEEVRRFEGGFALTTPTLAADHEGCLVAFVVEKLLPVLDPVRDLASLADFVFTDDALTIIARGRVRLAEQLASAVLAALARPALFDRVASGLLQNPNRAAAWRDVQDENGELLRRLIASLRDTAG